MVYTCNEIVTNYERQMLQSDWLLVRGKAVLKIASYSRKTQFISGHITRVLAYQTSMSSKVTSQNNNTTLALNAFESQ